MRTTVFACTIVLVATALSVQWGQAADINWRHSHGNYRVASLAHAYGPCREGWWQTLRYGHVRPYWGLRCR